MKIIIMQVCKHRVTDSQSLSLFLSEKHVHTCTQLWTMKIKFGQSEVHHNNNSLERCGHCDTCHHLPSALFLPVCDGHFPCRDREISVPEVRSKDHPSCCANYRYWQHQRWPHRRRCQGQTLPSNICYLCQACLFYANFSPHNLNT